ncbi:MAG: glycosyl hydrolase family 39, partial [Bryobacteraceae bacterium]
MRFIKTSLVLLSLPGALAISAAAQSGALKVNWTKVVRESKATPTLQVVVNSPLRRGSAIHDQVYREVKNLGAEYVRYVPWLPYQKLCVALLEPPSNEKTSCVFS